MLLPDPQDDNLAMLKAILVTLQNSSHVQPPSNANFNPTNSAVRVNSLWFGSLALTLGVAVQVMLAKQWLHKYGEGEHLPSRLMTWH
jgi:fucose permease